MRNALNPSPQSVADTEMGLYGTAGPMEAANQQGVAPKQGANHQHDTPVQDNQQGRSR